MTRYGPHRPEDAPAALPNPDRRVPDLVAVPPELLAQRARINTLAACPCPSHVDGAAECTCDCPLYWHAGGVVRHG